MAYEIEFHRGRGFISTECVDSMFRKSNFRVKNSISIRHSERKAFFPEEINACFNSKQQFTQLKVVFSNGATQSVFVHDKEPLFFQRAEDPGVLYPSVYFLWEHPGIFPVLYIHKSVFHFIQKGSDLMIPGIFMDENIELPQFNANTPVSIAIFEEEEENGRIFFGPVAVGKALLSSTVIQERLAAGQKGKAVEVLHIFGDFLWAYGTTKEYPILEMAKKTLNELEDEEQQAETVNVVDDDDDQQAETSVEVDQQQQQSVPSTSAQQPQQTVLVPVATTAKSKPTDSVALFLTIRENLYSLTEQVMPLFRPVGYRKGDLVDLNKIRQVLMDYAQKQGLVKDGEKKASVVLDDQLQTIFKYFLPDPFPINDLVQRLAAAMTKAIVVQLRDSGQQLVHRGNVTCIEIKVEKRAGNKLVTLVNNLITFGIDAKLVGKEIKGTGTSIQQAVNGCEGAQLLIQGNQVNTVGKVLSRFGVPNKFIKGLELGVKEKKKK